MRGLHTAVGPLSLLFNDLFTEFPGPHKLFVVAFDLFSVGGKRLCQDSTH